MHLVGFNSFKIYRYSRTNKMHFLYSYYYELTASTCSERGSGSSVGIVTDYGLDGPGIESWTTVRTPLHSQGAMLCYE
jgi:hypothetical protein